MFKNVLQQNTVDNELPTERKARHKFNMDIRKKVKSVTNSTVQENLRNHMETLQVQGSLLSLASRENRIATFNSFSFS